MFILDRRYQRLADSKFAQADGHLCLDCSKMGGCTMRFGNTVRVLAERMLKY